MFFFVASPAISSIDWQRANSLDYVDADSLLSASITRDGAVCECGMTHSA
jgi:hypothetical protein